MIIVFDFDHTLFCTENYKRALEKLFARNGVNPQQYHSDYLKNRSRGGLYSPFAQFRRLKKMYHLSSSEAQFRIDYKEHLGDVSNFIHDDALRLIARLRKKHKVYIISYGEHGHQRKKMQDSGIHGVVDGIRIVHNTKTDALGDLQKKHKGERIMYVDDAYDHLLDAKMHAPEIYTVQIHPTCRCRNVVKLFPRRDATINSIHQVENLLKKPASHLVPVININAWGKKTSARLAKNLLEKDLAIALPTETSYGLAALAASRDGLKRIYAIKSRSEAKRLPIMVRSIKEAHTYCQMTNVQKNFFRRYQDRVVSFRLNKRKNKLRDLSSDPTVVVRKAKHPFLVELSRDTRPFTVTSMNISAKPPVYSMHDYQKQYKNAKAQVDVFFDAGHLKELPPSTIVDLTQEGFPVLRQGKTKIQHAA